MKILVTGGNGFIGSSLVQRLIKESYQPIIIVRDKIDLYQESLFVVL